ncbi:hypothetical protein EVAR_64036_1 [Eumeta japonica]|uniref:Uncharacterized protein n=1 Tax=Eumeta variegata TaxID=151549 RepID=A0A4C1Z621_EUMVA|nr:hypothetical protein EVAR_64036_1 [Eumeta japonica]
MLQWQSVSGFRGARSRIAMCGGGRAERGARARDASGAHRPRPCRPAVTVLRDLYLYLLLPVLSLLNGPVRVPDRRVGSLRGKRRGRSVALD